MNGQIGRLRDAAAWTGDIFQVLVLDRFHPARRQSAIQAGGACRTLRFHDRARIPRLGWPELLDKLGAQPDGHVILPGSSTDMGGVGGAEYYYALGVLVKAVKPKTILEIGTYLGVGAYSMALNSPPDCRIFTVDLPEQTAVTPAHGLNRLDRTYAAGGRGRIGEAFHGKAQEEQITQIRADSLEFRADQYMSAADLCLIDGGHSLPCVTKDTENAFRVLAPDGVIVWDDYFHLYPDVVSFLDDLSGELPLFRIAGTNLVVYCARWSQQ
jgi:hypothetical protein